MSLSGAGQVMMSTLLLEENNIEGSEMTEENFIAGAGGLYKVQVNIEARTSAGSEGSVWLSVGGQQLGYSQMTARWVYCYNVLDIIARYHLTQIVLLHPMVTIIFL